MRIDSLVSNGIRYSYMMDTQILGGRLSWKLNFVRWRLIFVDAVYGTCL